MHVTLTGNLGSGKSTICKILEKKYGFEIYSTGTVQRKLAEERGLSVLEMNQLMCSDHKFDNMIDDATARISKENPDKIIIFDSRLAWNFVENSFKVFLSVDIDEAAKRVWNDNRGATEKYTSLQDTKDKLILRAETENARYKDIYNVEYFNFSNYNLVLDSTYASPEELADLMMLMFTQYEAQKGVYKSNAGCILMSPKRFDGSFESTPVTCGKYFNEDEIISVAAAQNGFEITDSREKFQKALKAGLPFISCKI